MRLVDDDVARRADVRGDLGADRVRECGGAAEYVDLGEGVGLPGQEGAVRAVQTGRAGQQQGAAAVADHRVLIASEDSAIEVTARRIVFSPLRHKSALD